MVFIQQIAEDLTLMYGSLTIFVVICVMMHGYRNEILAWPHALLILLFGPLFLFIYILVVIVQFRRDDIWKEKPSGMDKYSITRGGGELDSIPEKRRAPMPRPPPTRRKQPHGDDFEGYDSPPDWDI